mgnify:CR=1 FL=1
MGRLIDEDELVEEIKSLKIVLDGKDIFPTAAKDTVLRIISEQLTAYDPDKVVEQLKSVSYERYGNDGMGGELVVNLDDVVEIMRGGGVDG